MTDPTYESIEEKLYDQAVAAKDSGDSDALGKLLKTWREKHGLTQAALARMSGIPRETIGRFENNRLSSLNFTLPHLIVIFSALERKDFPGEYPGQSILDTWKERGYDPDDRTTLPTLRTILRDEFKKRGMYCSNVQELGWDVLCRESFVNFLNGHKEISPASVFALARAFERHDLAIPSPQVRNAELQVLEIAPEPVRALHARFYKPDDRILAMAGR